MLGFCGRIIATRTRMRGRKNALTRVWNAWAHHSVEFPRELKLEILRRVIGRRMRASQRRTERKHVVSHFVNADRLWICCFYFASCTFSLLKHPCMSQEVLLVELKGRAGSACIVGVFCRFSAVLKKSHNLISYTDMNSA